MFALFLPTEFTEPSRDMCPFPMRPTRKGKSRTRPHGQVYVVSQGEGTRVAADRVSLIFQNYSDGGYKYPPYGLFFSFRPTRLNDLT